MITNLAMFGDEVKNLIGVYFYVTRLKLYGARSERYLRSYDVPGQDSCRHLLLYLECLENNFHWENQIAHSDH